MNRWAAPIGLLVILLGLAGPARAGGTPTIPGTPLPAEPGTRALPTGATDAIAFDINGDGTRELVRFAPQTASPGLAAVEVYSFTAEGVPSAVLTKSLRRGTSVDERLTDRAVIGIDADGMTPVHLVGDHTEFLVARVSGVPRLLVATYGFNQNQPDPCCLTVWAVELSESFHGLRLVLDSQRTGQQVRVADLDGDGTDELVAVEQLTDDRAETGSRWEASFYRWEGNGYRRTAFPMDSLHLSDAIISDAGETDGLPGEEVVGSATSPADPTRESKLIRWSLRNGVPTVEVVSWAPNINPLVMDRDGGQLVTSSDIGAIQLVAWPAEHAPSEVTHWLVSGTAVAVIGQGVDSRILVSPIALPSGFALDVIDPASFAFPAIPPSRMAVLTADVDLSVPYFGATPPGIGPEGGYLFSGQIVTPTPNPAATPPKPVSVTLTDVSLMTNLRPIGTVGPGDAWSVVLARPLLARPGVIEPVSPLFETRIVATGLLLTRSEAPLEPTFSGLIGDPGDHLVGRADGHPEAAVAAPPGSILVTLMGSEQGGTTTHISSSPYPAEGLPLISGLTPAGGPGLAPSQVRLVTITPAGAVYQGFWKIQLLPGPPRLRVTGPGTVLGSGRLNGQTDPGTRVTVDRRVVVVAGDGSFTADVDGAWLPTEVRVVATDVLGQETVRVVSVVAPIDYRQLPWIPIAFVVVVIGGFIWWLRAPRRRPPPATSPGSTGTFEEIEA